MGSRHDLNPRRRPSWRAVHADRTWGQVPRAEKADAGYEYSDLIAANHGAAKCETVARSYEMPEDR